MTTTSHGWMGVIAGRDLLLKHLGKAIGDGESTSLLSDSWIHPSSNLKPIGPVLLQEKDLMVYDILTRETKEWNKDRILALVPELYDQILDIRPSTMGAQDSYIWPLEKTGDYSVKTGYFSIHSSDTQSTILLGEVSTWNWNKHLWLPPLQPKLKFFLWKVATNSLPTGANLQTRGLRGNTACKRCGAEETIAHILFHCDIA